MGELGAVILAAGLSSRMGEFKPLLRLGGMTVIRRVVQMAQIAGAEPIVIVTGHRAAEIESLLADENVFFVRNERYESTQMLDSLLIGLSKISPENRRVLITPGDIPLVRPETVRRLLNSDGQFVRPVFEGKSGHPVILKSILIPTLQSYSGNDGLRGAIKVSGVKISNVGTDDRGVLLDADTPDDYAKLCRYYMDEYLQKGRP